MIREFHLSPPGSGRGVSCDADGAFVGAIPILNRLRKNGKDEWRPCDCEQLSNELGAHYGLPIDMSSKRGGLRAIANALNQGDVARAQIGTVLLGIPDPPPLSKRACSRDQMIKLIRDLHWSGMIKWDEDEHPRWPAGSADGKGGEFAPKGEGTKPGTSLAARSDTIDQTSPYNAQQYATRRSARIQLADASISDAYDDPVAEAARAAVRDAEPTRSPMRPAQTFEQKYDNLTPVDFSKQVIQFGQWLERQGKSLSPAARQDALAEYNFLQVRLSFWLAYDYKSWAAHLNLVSAADLLYQGAINSGIVQVGHIPPSMLDVLGEAWGLEGGRSHIPSARAPNLEPVLPGENFGDIELPGRAVNNSNVGSGWGKGLMRQSGGWEDYIGRQYKTNKLPRNAKTFDHFNAESGEAISDKTLNTQTFGYINNPQKVYQRMKGYIDAAANYKKPRVKTDVDPARIKSRTIHLAIPEFTSPAQWLQLFRAIRYAKGRGVSLVVTKIRD